MIVSILGKTYKMSSGEADGLLKIASEAMPFGIYAAKKGNHIQMLNLIPPSRSKLKAEIRGFKQKGFRVYYNGLRHIEGDSAN